MHLGCILHTSTHPVTSLPQKQCHLVVGHTLRYTVSKFGVNGTNGSRDTAIFVPPPQPCSCSKTLPECVPLLIHLLHQICHSWPTRCQFLYHSLQTTGLPMTRRESFAYSSASWRLGPEFTRSRLRKNLISCSASWAKRAMPPWTDGYQQMRHTRTTLLSS